MTYKDNAKTIGKKATIGVMKGLKINVKILDYKLSYGHDRWLVEPISGEGQVWVEVVTLK